MYPLACVEAPGADDHPYALGGEVSSYVRDGDLSLVRGTEVAYGTRGLNASLRFRNPNETARCGCGESFSV